MYSVCLLLYIEHLVYSLPSRIDINNSF